MRNKLFIYFFIALYNISFSQELIIGEERVEPGIVFIFEGAIKDHVMPMGLHLAENETNIHIEARVNWDTENIPDGTPTGGFVAYLHITAKITNENSGLSTFIDLLPHLNLIDNYHYARNISLPGKLNDKYKVEFNVLPPTEIELSFHKDWSKMYGNKLFEKKSFIYTNVDFEEIANASRK